MALLLVDGIDRSSYVLGRQPVVVRKTFNNRSEATVTLKPGFIPARQDEVVIYKADGTTPDFGGIVFSRRVFPLEPQAEAALCEVTCVDFLAYADYITTTRVYPAAVAPEDVIDDLVTDHLAAFGFTFTPPATGLTLDPFEWNDVVVAEAMRRVADSAGLIIKCSPTKVLTLEAPGASSGPWTITDANMHATAFGWEDPPDIPATRIVVRCGPSGVALSTQRWTANGSATSWVTDIPATGQPALVLVDDGVSPFLGTVGAGAMFEWDLTTNAPYGTLSVGTYGTPANGVLLVLGPTLAAGDPFETDGFLGVYPFDAVADSGASPTVEQILRAESVTSPSEGQALATSLLASAAAGTQPLSVMTTEGDQIEPGDAITVNVSLQGGINDTFIVQSIEKRVQPGVRFCTMVLVDADRIRSGTIDEWRDMLGAAGGGAAALVASGGSGSTTISGAFSPVYLGGIGAIGSFSAAAYTDVPMAMPHVAQVTFTGRVRVSLWAREAGGGVTLRLYNVTDATSAAASSQVTSTTATEVTFVVSIVAGKRYVAQAMLTAGSGEVYTSPIQLEIAA